MMKPIENLLAEAISQSKNNMVSFMTKNKVWKEQWVLGKFVTLYNEKQTSGVQITYAKKLLENELGDIHTPDFAVYNINRELVAYVEITEALDKERTRDAEYKSSKINTKGVEAIDEYDYFPLIQDRLNDKCKKLYPQKTWLVVYQNIFASIYDDFPTSQLTTLQIPDENLFNQISILDSAGEQYINLCSKK